MDDPSRRNPQAPDAPNAPAVVQAPQMQVHHVQHVQHVQAMAPIPSLPGMPPIPPMPMTPGVSVQIQNVVAPMPVAIAPAPTPFPYAAPIAPAPAAIGAERPQGVVAMMKEDAAQKAMEAVSRRGPARVLAYSVAVVMLATMVGLLALLPLGIPAFAIAVAEVPCLAVAIAALVVGKRVGQGPGGHQLEQAILRVAAQNDGVFRVVGVAQATGRPLKECQLAIDAMVASGHATVDADDRGGLVYRIPDLEPRTQSDGGR